MLIDPVLIVLVAAAAGPADSLDRLRELEDRTVAADYADTAAELAIQDISTQSGVAIWADWEALRGIGVGRDDEITLRLRAVPARAALQAVALSLGDEDNHPVIEADEGRVILTSTRGAASLRFTRVYDIRPLLSDASRTATATDAVRQSIRDQQEPLPPPPPPTGDVPVQVDKPRAAPQRDVPLNPQEGRNPDFEIPPLELPAEPTADELPPLVRLMMDHVDPDAWIGLGGVRARMDERDGMLMLTATPRVHLALQRLIEQLLLFQADSVPLEVAVVAIDTAPLELLERRLQPGSAALAAALLDLGPDSIVWRTRTVAALGATSSAASVDGALAVQVEMLRRFDPALGRLSLDLSVVIRRGGHESTVRGTLVTGTQGGGVLELPSTGSDANERLLAVVVVGAGQ